MKGKKRPISPEIYTHISTPVRYGCKSREIYILRTGDMGINSKTYFGYGVCVIMYVFYPRFSFGNGSGIVRECFALSFVECRHSTRDSWHSFVLSYFWVSLFFLRARHAWDGQYLPAILTDRKEVVLIQ